MNFKKGFTLIELLVVIAIIGILSGIVLTSLGTARNKAKMASAKASMSSMRSEAELGADNAGTYNINVCAGTVSGNLGNLVTAVNNQTTNYDVACDSNVVTTARGSAWGAAVELDGTEGVYCVDSTGFAGITTVPATAADDGAVEIAVVADPAVSGDVVCDNT